MDSSLRRQSHRSLGNIILPLGHLVHYSLIGGLEQKTALPIHFIRSESRKFVAKYDRRTGWSISGKIGWHHKSP